MKVYSIYTLGKIIEILVRFKFGVLNLGDTDI